MPYRLFIPRDYDPRRSYPLVVYLHGSGGLGSDNLKQISSANAYGPRFFMSQAVQSKHPALILAPQAPNGTAWSSSGPGSTLSFPARLMVEIVQALQREYSIDASRLYITGQSLGGFGTWDIITRRPDLFAAAAPLCGGGRPDAAKAIKHIPIWAFHGAADDNVPVERSREMVAALRNLGSTIRYNEYPGIGHPVWVRAYTNPALIEWMFAQHRSQ